MGRDPGIGKSFVEHPSGRPHERLTFEVLRVPGLLPHQHDRRRYGARPEDDLGGFPVQLAGGAFLGCKA
jgi:hypothetical protein